MNFGVSFSICSVLYIILLNITFFSKERVSTVENKSYIGMMISNLLGVIIAIICYFCMASNVSPLLSQITSKLYLIYVLTWMTFFTRYIMVISYTGNRFNKYYKLMKRILLVVYIMASIVLIYLPIDIINNNGVVYSNGDAANFLSIVTVIGIITWIILCLRNYKHLKNKKYLPVFVFIFLGGIVMVLQKLYPQLLIITYLQTFVTFLMYFTIENPDVHILNEMYKNKELMEQTYEDKYNFLFEVTQEARNPLVQISSLCNEINEEKDIQKIKSGVVAINNLVRQLDFSINDIMNVSSFDVQKLKIINSKYDLSKLCHELVTRCKNDTNENVEFKYNYPQESVLLDGDYLKIKQILYSLITNSLQKTKKGYVDFKVSTILKYDVCRIIFTINDCAEGMSLETINDILSITGELDQEEIQNMEKNDLNVKLCQKVIKIIGGNMMIKSDIGKGTEFKLVIDQKVYHDKDESVLSQYDNYINNYKKALIVAQDKRLISKLKKRMYDNNITYSVLMYGKDAIDRIKEGKNYDYLFIQDEMKEMSGLMTLKGIKEVNERATGIIMLDKDKEHIKKHYLEDGFIDYLLLDDFDNEIKRIIEKY